MADAHGSGPCVRKDVRVQLPPRPPLLGLRDPLPRTAGARSGTEPERATTPVTRVRRVVLWRKRWNTSPPHHPARITTFRTAGRTLRGTRGGACGHSGLNSRPLDA